MKMMEKTRYNLRVVDIVFCLFPRRKRREPGGEKVGEVRGEERESGGGGGGEREKAMLVKRVHSLWP